MPEPSPIKDPRTHTYPLNKNPADPIGRVLRDRMFVALSAEFRPLLNARWGGYHHYDGDLKTLGNSCSYCRLASPGSELWQATLGDFSRRLCKDLDACELRRAFL